MQGFRRLKNLARQRLGRRSGFAPASDPPGKPPEPATVKPSLREPLQHRLRSPKTHAATWLAIGLAPTILGSALAEEAAPSRFHAVSNFEFADKYLTPRGMVVHDNGLTFQWLALGLFNLYHGDSFVSDVTLVGGVWNDFCSEGVSIHAPFGSTPKTSWVEIDAIGGVSVSFANQFKLDVTYTVFNMQVLDIGISQHLETKLSYDDTPYLKAFALHPYLLFWQELQGKATAARVPYAVFKNQFGPDSSYYFELGVAPGYTIQNLGLKLEAPVRVLLPNSDFYGEYYGKGSTVGLYEVGVKATLPLKFVPAGYGFWNVHGGVRYMNFVDDNLQGMQQFNAPGRAIEDSVQVYFGINAFF